MPDGPDHWHAHNAGYGALLQARAATKKLYATLTGGEIGAIRDIWPSRPGRR